MNKNEQAIRAMKTLKSNYSTANYSILRAELDLAIQALKNEQKRLELIEKYKRLTTIAVTRDNMEDITHVEHRKRIIEGKLSVLKDCEVSDE